jgi:isoleucyl-tRNA synthetase
LKFWLDGQIFEKSLEIRKNGPYFSTYDGPPFATGLPHYGHLLAGTIKDVIPRYKTMKGFFVPRRFGWDCHGLPVENEIEKSKNLTGAASIEKFGIANFNEECRSIVLRYMREWKSTVQRMGRWIDLENTYKTMDTSFMESVWWVFKQLFDKDLIYEGYKVMPYSAKLGTPLSNFEAQENYKDVDDPSLTVAVPLLDEKDTSLLIWTTTPWTLVSNLAIVVGADIEYVKIRDVKRQKNYILAKERLSEYYPESDLYEIVSHMKGSELVGRSYQNLFPYFANLREYGAFRVIADGFVTLEDGTGLVHAAPGFGEADFYACQKHNLPVVCPVDQNGQFTQEISHFVGRFVKDCDKDLIKALKEQGLVFRHESIRHRYPFCWRSDTPLIYKAVATWFVAVEKIKDKLLKANDQIYWMPEHIKSGRFGKWLENARDWAISRNRYWGTPIPIWRAEDGDIVVIGSIKELETYTGAKIKDLHRHFIDQLEFTKDGKLFKRVPEVFDCWFESGSVPYASNHYPFENQEKFLNTFPADFIAEGLDQTRGWFYTLTVLSAALFDTTAFKHVIVNGIILAADGNKMSKRLKNYPDPQELLQKQGADAIRLYMLASPAVKAEDLCFSQAGVDLTLRQVLIPLWNAYSFFITYARLYQFKPQNMKPFRPAATIDRWMLSITHKLIHNVDHALTHYDLNASVHPLVDFVDQLTNWYIRRSRRRFWNDDDTQDRREAFQTLYIVLTDFIKLCAPFVPFIAEAIYQNLKLAQDPESVHLSDFPAYDEKMRDLQLEDAMQIVQRAVSLGHSLRKEKKIKVRQPLSLAYIITPHEKERKLLIQELELIQDELNVEKVEIIADEKEFVRLKPKPNFRVLGKKIGKLMKQAHVCIEALSQSDLERILKGETIELSLGNETIQLTNEDVDVQRQVKDDLVALNDGELTVALETHLTDALISQGVAREIINKINTQRKDEGLDISDRIDVVIQTSDDIQKAVREHEAFIASEILAKKISFGPSDGAEVDINSAPTRISITKCLK